MGREADSLERIRRKIQSVRPPPRVARDFRTYLEILDNQILIDRRIARAAAADDDVPANLGMRQNQFNRDRRTEIAEKKLHLSRCLLDASAT
jgi:hypothetical protein